MYSARSLAFADAKATRSDSQPSMSLTVSTPWRLALKDGLCDDRHQFLLEFVLVCFKLC